MKTTLTTKLIAKAIKAGTLSVERKCPVCGNADNLLKSGGQPIGAMARAIFEAGYDVYFCLSCGHLFGHSPAHEAIVDNIAEREKLSA